MQLIYDESLATEADIKEHTINYSVTFAAYNGITSDLNGSFTFEILPSDEAFSVPALDESNGAPISLDPIASEYLLYFNETSELIFNFADPMVYFEGTRSPTALSIEMITNSLPFVPTLVTDYSGGVGYGTLKVTIDG